MRDRDTMSAIRGFNRFMCQGATPEQARQSATSLSGNTGVVFGKLSLPTDQKQKKSHTKKGAS